MCSRAQAHTHMHTVGVRWVHAGWVYVYRKLPEGCIWNSTPLSYPQLYQKPILLLLFNPNKGAEPFLPALQQSTLHFRFSARASPLLHQVISYSRVQGAAGSTGCGRAPGVQPFLCLADPRGHWPLRFCPAGCPWALSPGVSHLELCCPQKVALSAPTDLITSGSPPSPIPL